MATKKGKKSKGVTISFQEFSSKFDGEGSAGQNVVYAPKKPAFSSTSWADEVEEDELITEKERIVLPSAPRASRGPAYDDSEIPRSPPFQVNIGNLNYDIEEDEIMRFFKDLDITEIKLPRDRETNRLKGFGFVNFSSRADLIEALVRNEQMLRGRPVRIALGQGQEGQRSRDGGMRSNRGPAEDEGVDNWRTVMGDRPPIGERPVYPEGRQNSDRGSRGGATSDVDFGDVRAGPRTEFREQGGFGGGRDEWRGGQMDRRNEPEPDFRRNEPDFRRNEPDFRRNEPDFRRNEPDFRRNEPDFRRNEPDFRRNEPDYRRNEGQDFRRNEGQDYRRNEGQDYRRNEGQDSRRNEEPDFRRSEVEPRPDYRAERRDERSERGERSERSERSERGERSERSERPERDERSERGERSERVDSPPPGSPKQRKRLILAPRTVTAASSEESGPSAIFGGARPVDTTKREKEIEEKLKVDGGKEDAKKIRDRRTSSEASDRVEDGVDRDSHSEPEDERDLKRQEGDRGAERRYGRGRGYERSNRGSGDRVRVPEQRGRGRGGPPPRIARRFESPRVDKDGFQEYAPRDPGRAPYSTKRFEVSREEEPAIPAVNKFAALHYDNDE